MVKISSRNFQWLKEAEPWTALGAEADLFSADDQTKEDLRTKLLKHPHIKSMVDEVRQWYPESYTRHNDPKISHYKLMMLAEMGLRKEDQGMKEIIQQAKVHREDDFFAMKQSLPSRKGDQPEGWHALPCDSPIISYSLLLLGDRSDEVMASVDSLADQWKKSQGWFCNFFFVNGQFKRTQCACPMAGLMALQVFSQVDSLKESESALNAFRALEVHRDLKKTLYYFGRSKKFWTVKYPFVWYNGFYMAEVLSRFPQFHDTELVGELKNWLLSLLDEDGRVRPTSMFRIYKDWDFANKKEHSPWLTFLTYRMLERYQGA
jgi:hypothetical protein